MTIPGQWTRRRWLATAGAGLAAAGGSLWGARGLVFLGESSPAGVAPWLEWAPDDHDPLGIVRAGILAASPHNTQPWLFRVGRDRIDVFADTTRHLGPLDPVLRLMSIGVGCAIENLVVAALRQGFSPAVSLTAAPLRAPGPTAAPMHVARVLLGPPGPETEADARLRALAEAIPARRTHRGRFVARALSSEDVLALSGQQDVDVRVFIVNDRAAMARVGDLIDEAARRLAAEPRLVEAARRWYRPTPEAIERHRDGRTFDTAGRSWLQATAAQLVPWRDAPSGADAWLELVPGVQTSSAAAFGVVAVRGQDEMRQHLRAGRLWQRVHLMGTLRGLAMQPLNHPIMVGDQERADGRTSKITEELARIAADRDWTPVFVFRVGHPGAISHRTPRRPIDEVVLWV